MTKAIEHLKKTVREYLKLYTTKDNYYFRKPDNLKLALVALLKDYCNESRIQSLHSKYIRDIKNKVSFRDASKSFFASLDKETDSSLSSEFIAVKETKKEKIRKYSHSVKNRKIKKYKKK